MNTAIPIPQMRLTRRHFRLWAIASAEQIIGAALSTLAGIAIPMIQITGGVWHLNSFMQGLTGAMGLLGIAVGSPLIGRVSDRQGYLRWFRICPLLILAGSLLVWLCPQLWAMLTGLFIMGFGVGGGYTLDSDYISETMPARWRQMMVGAAKATCSLGFAGAAGIAWWWIKSGLQPAHWNYLFIITGALGLITLLLRIDWAGSPSWLMAHGRRNDAIAAARCLLGPDAVPQEVSHRQTDNASSAGSTSLFRGKNLLRVIFSGATWACEGVGVYGVGVFMPLIILALGIDHSDAQGMGKVLNSVEMTTLVNSCILPGFIIGLLILRHINHGKMMTAGFLISAAGMALLLWAYSCHLPVWVSVAAFIIFEMALNAGPHLVTFIIPSQIYPLADRGAGTGVAASCGKIGAIAGVFLMPVLLDAGGITLVLWVCIGVMLLGGLISLILTPVVLPGSPSASK